MPSLFYKTMRNLSVDVLKVVMAFFVVFLHMHLLKDVYPTISYVLVNGLFRLGVPIFLIITGYYFYHIDDVKKLKNWLFRLFILYSIWTVIYIPFWKEKESSMINILFGYHHLWYLIGAFWGGIVLFYLKKLSVSLLVFLAVFLFGVGYTIQFLANSHYFNGEIDTTINKFFTYRNFLFVCFPFLTIGFLIKKYQIEKKFHPNFLLTVLLCFLVIGEAYFNIEILKLNKKESVDLLLSLVVACPVLFIYCKNRLEKIDSKILANISTAIYFIHPLLMELIFGEQNILNMFLFFSSLLLASLALVFINKKVKYLL